MQVERQGKRTDCLWNAPAQWSIQKTAHGYHTSQQGIPSKNGRTIPRGKRVSITQGFGKNSNQTINNHDQNLRACLQICRERNIKINLYKCKFMGHTLTNAGLKPDEEKMRAITEFPASHNLHHLRRFIGMIKYLSKFDHSLTTKCEPLNKLTWKDQVY